MAITVGSAIGSAIKENKVYKIIKETDKYIEKEAEDLACLDSKYQDGVISQEEYQQYKEEIGDTEYISGLLETPQFYEEKALLKNETEKYILCAGAGIIAA